MWVTRRSGTGCTRRCVTPCGHGEPIAASALRSALAALDNAGAVPPGPVPAAATGPHFAGAVAGLGAGEVPRRGLAAGEAEQIVRAEIAEREAAATGYERAGDDEQALSASPGGGHPDIRPAPGRRGLSPGGRNNWDRDDGR